MVNPILKTRIQRKLNLATSKAVVGDENGVVFDDPVNRKGYIRVRRRTAAGLSKSFVVRLGRSFQMELRPGAAIILSWEDGEEVALGPDVVSQIASGDDPLRNNAAHRPRTRWTNLSDLNLLRSTPNSPESLYVTVSSFIYRVNGTFYHFNASEDNGSGVLKGLVNLTNYIPAANYHRLAGLFLTDGNVIAVGASAVQTMDLPVDLSDLQECADGYRNAVPVAFWHLHDNQSTITQDDWFMDGKEIINIPFGFLDNLDRALAADDGILRAQIFDFDPMMTSDPLALEIFS